MLAGIIDDLLGPIRTSHERFASLPVIGNHEGDGFFVPKCETKNPSPVSQNDVVGIDGNLSVATSTTYVTETVTESIDDLDELADLDF